MSSGRSTVVLAMAALVGLTLACSSSGLVGEPTAVPTQPDLTPAATEPATEMPTVTAEPTDVPTPVSVDPAVFGIRDASERLFPALSTSAVLGPDGNRIALAIGTVDTVDEDLGGEPHGPVPEEGVMILDRADLSQPNSFPMAAAVNEVAWQGGWIFAGLESGEVIRLDVAQGQFETLTDTGDGMVMALAPAPDGSEIAVASYGVHDVLLLDPQTGEVSRRVPGHQTTIFALAWSPDGSLLATAAGDVLRLWDGETLVRSEKLEGHEHFIREIAWTPDGALVATVSDDGTVRVWDPESGDLVHRLWPAEGNLHSLAISPDGAYLAAGSSRGTIPIWELETGDQVITLEEDWSVHSLMWAPDGVLFSATIPTTVRLGGRVVAWGPPEG